MSSLIIISDASQCGDDCIAIAMLANTRPTDIRLIVATSGNVWAEEVADNIRTLFTVLHQPNVHICIGTPSLLFKAQHRKRIHHALAQPGLQYTGAFSSEPRITQDGTPICHDLFEQIVAADRPDIIVIGPADSLASVSSQHNNLASYVSRIYLMGGVLKGIGNTTADAEFNFWFDAEAAEILLRSDLPITLLPLDATRNLRYPPQFTSALDPAYPSAKYVRDCIAHRPSRPVHDEALAAVVIDESVIVRRTLLKLEVEASLGPRYGAVKRLSSNATRRPVEVIEELDEPTLWEVMRSSLTR
jgi:inosine-uridine nucleoside N-ribohydrolase